MEKIKKGINTILKTSKRNVGIIVGGMMLVFLMGYIFRDKIPFFSADPGNNPTAYWNFNEGFGITINDSVSTNNGTFGTGTSAPSWIAEDRCVTGKCLSFDGTSDYVYLGTAAELNLFDDFTVSGWIKQNSGAAGTARVIFSSGDVEGTYWNVQIDSSSILTFSEDGAGSVSGKQVIPTGQWTYITVVKSGDVGNNITFYINGILDSSASAGAVDAAGNKSIGARLETGGLNFFNGFIDDLKIYAYARSADQIKADYASRGSTKGVSAELGNGDIGKILSNGLIGYWEMDENTGVATSDASGNNYSSILGAGNSAPAWGMGKYGSALSFDGVNDYSQVVSSSTAADFTSGQDFTISAWVNKTTLGASGAIAVKKIGTTFSSGYEIYINPTGKVAVYISDGTNGVNLFSTDLITAATWTHVTVVYKHAESLKAYINGVDAGGTVAIDTGSLQSMGSLTSVNKLTFGTESDRNAFFFDGLLDDIRVYNRAFSSREVLQLSEWGPGPVGYWNLNENVGGTANDISGNANPGNLQSGTGAPIWSVGKYGSSLEFDGTADYVYVTDPVSGVLDFGTGDFSYTFWVKTALSPVGGVQFLYKRDAAGGNQGYSVALLNSKVQTVLDDGVATEVNSLSVSDVNDNKWHHIGVVNDRDGLMNLYIDGLLEDSDSIAGSTATVSNSSNLTFGKSSIFAAQYLGGSLDDVKIYNYARTQKQIIQDMNAGHPAVGSPVGSAFTHFRFDEGYGSTVNNSGNMGSMTNGTLASGTAAPSWANDGKFGKALRFDGTADYIWLGSTAPSFVNNSFSISVWSKRGSTGGGFRNMISRGSNSTNNGLYFGFRATDVFTFSFFSNDLDTTQTFTDIANWHHYVGTYDASTNARKIYYDANLLITDTSSADYGGTGPLLIGGGPVPGASSFRGSIDEVKIYNYSLTKDEVKVEYNKGKSIVLGASSTGLGGTSPSFSSDRSFCVPGDNTSCAPPVGEWNFNENIGSSAMDIGGSGNTAFLGGGNSAPTWASGKVGSALKYDGTNDYVSTNSSVSLVSGDFTMSGWVYFDTEKNYSGVFGKFNDCAGSPTIAYDFCIGAGAGGAMWAAVTNNAGSLTAQADLVESYAGRWIYVAMVWDGVSKVDLYKNGVFRATDTQALTLSTTKFPVRFGGGAGRHMPGKIDEVRLYDYARTPAQIAWEYNQGKPAVYYRMDECTGSTVNDSSGNGNTGTITIGPSGTQTSTGTCSSGNSTQAWNNGTNGKRNYSLNFDGEDDEVSLPLNTENVSVFKVNQSYSWSMWIKPNLGLNNYNIYGTIGSDLSTLDILSNHDGGINESSVELLWTNNNTADACYWSSRLTDMTSQWTHVVFTYDGSLSGTSRGKVYVNGKEFTNQNSTYTDCIGTIADVNGDTSTLIGTGNFATHYDGQLDDFKVFNYALTPAQIKTDMAGGSVRFQ